jgi:cell division protein FtsL
MMTEIDKVAQFGAVGIALTLILSIVYVIRMTLPELIKVVNEMRSSIEANTKITTELADYIHMRNGKMEKAIERLSKTIDRLKNK